jgi:hypothetical protein
MLTATAIAEQRRTAFFDGLCCSYSTLRKTASVEDIFRTNSFSSARGIFSSASGAWGPTFAERIETGRLLRVDHWAN